MTLKRYKPILRIMSALAMAAIGAKHFTDPEPFVSIVPSVLPHPFTLVYASGFLEVLGGIGLLFPHFSRAAAWLLIILLISVFPANLYQAVHNIPVSGLPHDPPPVWLRLPFQALLVAWAWWFTQDDEIPTTVDPQTTTEP